MAPRNRRERESKGENDKAGKKKRFLLEKGEEEKTCSRTSLFFNNYRALYTLTLVNILRIKWRNSREI